MTVPNRPGSGSSVVTSSATSKLTAGDLLAEKEVRLLVLERVRLTLRQYYSQEMIDAMSLQERIDYLTEFFVYTFRASIWANKVNEFITETYRIPVSPWHAFVHHYRRWMPNFLTRKIKYVDKPMTVVHQHVCPHLPIMAPPEENEVHLHFLEDPHCKESPCEHPTHYSESSKSSLPSPDGESST